MKKSRRKMVTLFMVMIMLLIGCSSTAYCKELPSAQKSAPYIINNDYHGGGSGSFSIRACNYGVIGSGSGYSSYEYAIEHPLEINSCGYIISAELSYHGHSMTVPMFDGDSKMLAISTHSTGIFKRPKYVYLYVVMSNPSNANSQSENKLGRIKKPYIIRHNYNCDATNAGRFIITSEKYGFIGWGNAYYYEDDAASNIIEVKSNSKITVELRNVSYYNRRYFTHRLTLHTGDSGMLRLSGYSYLYVIVSPWTPEESETETNLTSEKESELNDTAKKEFSKSNSEAK